jgi:predicted DNA-binding protein (MmcQ/YjbR family)
MNHEEIREYCLSKPAVTEGFPFNDTALVFKVAGKMFALLDLSEDQRGISLKCDPELAIELRERHPEVTGAYHFSKVIMQLFSTIIKNRSFQFIQILPGRLAFM